MSGDKSHTDNRAGNRAEPIRTTLGLLPMIALTAALTGQAHAQGNDVVLGEINVDGGTGSASGTGVKRDRIQSQKATAPLINTPQTVTVVPERVIEERGASDLTEVLRNTPGISFDAGENGFAAGGDQIFLRGMNAVGSIFTDGSRDNGGRSRDTFNTEQVEVVKGTASSNGRGVGAGYINMVTKTPTLEDFIAGSARVGFDDDGRTRARSTVDVNKVIDNFAVRFNGMVEGGKVFGRDFSDADSWGVAPSLAYGLGTDFRAIFAYEHTEKRGLPDSGVRVNHANGMAFPGVGINPVAGSAPRDAYFNNTNRLLAKPNGYDDTKSDSLLARLEYDVTDWLTISNQTRWSRVDRNAEYFYAASATPYFIDRVNNTFTNQTNLTAEFDTGSLSHTLSAGLEFSSEKADSIRQASTDLRTTKVDTVAAYVYDTIELSPQWLINGGLRAERYSVDLTSQANDIPGGLASTSGSYTTVGGQFGVVYKPRPDGSIYASYGLSHLPHGSLLSNPDPSRGNNAFPGFIPGAKPVEAHNFEAGVKWDFFGGDLSVTGALFRTEKHGVPVAHAGTQALLGYQKHIVQGVELGIAGNITSQWSVFGGATILKSERKIDAALDAAQCLTNTGDMSTGGAANCGVMTRNGDELAFTPKFTANLWSTYDINEKWTLGGGFQYVGGSWVGRPDDAHRMIKNGRYGKLPGHFLVNVMAAYNINENVTLRFNIDNLFNETYLSTVNWNSNWGYLGAPRTYRFGTSFKF